MKGFASRRILIVDDDRLTRELLRTILLQQGFDTVSATNTGEKALNAMRRHPRPEMVLLDIKLPGQDGLEVLDRIHSDYPDVQVVMISSDATRDHVRQAVDKGATGFIAKPFSTACVKKVIDRAIWGSAAPV